jgi:hypothetical protein
MIRYDLRCRHGHAFDAWFRDSAGYRAQRAAGDVECPICGDTNVEKALMAPAIGRDRSPAVAAPSAPVAASSAAAPTGANATPAAPSPAPALSAVEGSPLAQALTALRQHLEKDATYVGRRFAEEARRMHEAEEAPKPIWGEATREEAEALLEDGIPVAPLPPLPRRDD